MSNNNEDKKFKDWLLQQLIARDMTQADLARKAGMTRAAINGVITGARNPGATMLAAIAQALNLPPEEVLQAAGLIPSRDFSFLERMNNLFSQLPPEDQQDIIDYINMKILKREKKGHKSEPLFNQGE